LDTLYKTKQKVDNIDTDLRVLDPSKVTTKNIKNIFFHTLHFFLNEDYMYKPLDLVDLSYTS
jgi:hypothetical protein